MRAPWSIEAEDALLAATEQWIAAVDRWLAGMGPKSAEESRVIYEAAVEAVRRIRVFPLADTPANAVTSWRRWRTRHVLSSWSPTRRAWGSSPETLSAGPSVIWRAASTRTWPPGPTGWS